MDWIKEINKRDIEERLKIGLLKYISTCYERNIPVVINLLHLSKVLAIDYLILKRMINSSKSFYYEFDIPKRSGGSRRIAAPYPSIAYIQKWIVNEILLKFSPHESATGYISGKSIVNHVKPHAKNKCILIIDLKDFFPSINLNYVKNLFREIGYPDHISYFFAKLCLLNNELPQGAPSSPIICNLVSYSLDLRLSKFCTQNNLTYTRYVDDICVSGVDDFKHLNKDIFNLVESQGFRINDKKIRYINGFGKKKIITGISIGSGRIKLPRKIKRKWRIEIHNIVKYGVLHHMKVNKIVDPIYLNRCIGKLYYWKMIEPDNQFVTESIDELKKMEAGNTKGLE